MQYISLEVVNKNRLNQAGSLESPGTREENIKHVAAFIGNNNNNIVWCIFFYMISKVVLGFG